MRHYFFSYQWTADDRKTSGHGNCEITRETPITTYADIEGITEVIKGVLKDRHATPSSVVIFQWREFEKPPFNLRAYVRGVLAKFRKQK